MDKIPDKKDIKKGTSVSIETKIDQGTGRLTEGTVDEILTNSESHPYGIKVNLHDGQVGRVKNILSDIKTSSKKSSELRALADPNTEKHSR